MPSGGIDPGSPRPVTTVVADDSGAGTRRLRAHPEGGAGVDVLAEAADGEQAIAAVLQHRPDVVLMDIRMPRLDGIEATRQIVAAGAAGTTRIIILTTFDLDEYVYAALSAGASGFLLKDVTPEHLVAAVQLVRTGDALLAPSVHPPPGRTLRPPAIRGDPRSPRRPRALLPPAVLAATCPR